MSTVDTAVKVKKPRSEYAKPTERRVGPPCPTCGRSQPVSGIPKGTDPAKLAAKVAQIQAKLAVLAGMKTVPIAAKE